jgi:ribosomal protein S18 acetylase RimI-like enzyme
LTVAPAVIRRARPADADTLTNIARAAKAHWNYAPELLEAWREELTIRREAVLDHPTFVIETGGGIAGWCRLLEEHGEVELQHFWIAPQSMRQGLGRVLLAHVCGELAQAGVEWLAIEADPNAEPFYVACGAVRTGELAAPIPGEPDRVRPLLRLPTSR